MHSSREFVYLPEPSNIGYGATTFPALTEALDEKNVTLAVQETERLAKLISRLTATLILR